MAATEPVYGTVLNPNDVQEKKTGPVKASTTLAIGLVYEDGTNGWDNAPVDGSIPGNQLYWNEKARDNSAGVKGAISATFFGGGARVVGKSDGIIPIDGRVKASTTASHNGQFITHATPTVATADEGDTSTTDLGGEIATAINTVAQAIYTFIDDSVGFYRGHVLEVIGNDTLGTASADEDTNIVVEIVRS